MIADAFARVKNDIQNLSGYVANFATEQKGFNYRIYDRIVELEKENRILKEDLSKVQKSLKGALSKVKKDVKELQKNSTGSRIVHVPVSTKTNSKATTLKREEIEYGVTPEFSEYLKTEA